MIVIATCTFLTAAVGQLDLSLDKSTGGYEISVDGKVWFTSGATGFTRDHATRSTADGSLRVHSAASGGGVDSLGVYESTEISWVAASAILPELSTTFKLYKSIGVAGGSAIVFEQHFPQGARGTALNASDPYSSRDGVSSMFPSLAPAAGAGPLGYLAFAGDMTGSGYQHGTDFGQLPSGVKGTGPICFFDKALRAAVVLSPFSNFMAASSAHVAVGSGGGDHLAYGAQGSITAYPKDYTLSFILTLGPAKSTVRRARGVNAALEFWGDALLATYGKSRIATYATDFGLRYLSYSTDNGAFYYYQTEGGPGGAGGPPYKGNASYERTLIDVKRYADRVGLPYRYVLLDSWWYYQGKGSGVSEWVGRPDVFPHGNAFVVRLGLGLGLGLGLVDQTSSLMAMLSWCACRVLGDGTSSFARLLLLPHCSALAGSAHRVSPVIDTLALAAAQRDRVAFYGP